MIKIKTVLISNLLILCFSLFSQSEIETFSVDDLQIFTKVIEDETYFYSNESSNQNDLDEGVSVSKLSGNMLEELSFIDTLNDSLICIRFIDFWYQDNSFHFLAYCRNSISGQNYISVAQINFSTQKVDVLSSTPIQIFEYETTFNHHLQGVTEYRTWVIIEDTNLNTKAINAIRLQYHDGLLFAKRFSLENYPNTFSLDDAYYEMISGLYYVYTGDTFFILDDNFELINSKKYVVETDAIRYNGPEALIMGHDKDSLIMVERVPVAFGDRHRNLIIRKNLIRGDSIDYSTIYELYNPDDDCYFVRKCFKEDYNYLQFSRSSANGFNDDYGFNILQFTKQGELLCDYRVDFDRPMVMFSFDFIDANNIVGSGTYVDNLTNVDHFLFKLKLDDIKTSTETTLLSLTESMIIQNPVTEYLYLRSDKYARSHIIDSQGRIIYSGVGETHINISHLSSGAYVFQYQIRNGWKNERFIKL